jgi:hypothetical protein
LTWFVPILARLLARTPKGGSSRDEYKMSGSIEIAGGGIAGLTTGLAFARKG